MDHMIATGWLGGGYGLRIDIADRDRFLKREWKCVILQLEGEATPVRVNVDKASFWEGSCQELIKKEIEEWLHKNGLAPWPKGYPPKLSMERISGNRFFVRKQNLR